VTID